MDLCSCVSEYHRDGEGGDGERYLGCHIHVDTLSRENVEIYYRLVRKACTDFNPLASAN